MSMVVASTVGASLDLACLLVLGADFAESYAIATSPKHRATESFRYLSWGAWFKWTCWWLCEVDNISRLFFVLHFICNTTHYVALAYVQGRNNPTAAVSRVLAVWAQAVAVFVFGCFWFAQLASAMSPPVQSEEEISEGRRVVTGEAGGGAAGRRAARHGWTISSSVSGAVAEASPASPLLHVTQPQGGEGNNNNHNNGHASNELGGDKVSIESENNEQRNGKEEEKERSPGVKVGHSRRTLVAEAQAMARLKRTESHNERMGVLCMNAVLRLGLIRTVLLLAVLALAGLAGNLVVAVVRYGLNDEIANSAYTLFWKAYTFVLLPSYLTFIVYSVWCTARLYRLLVGSGSYFRRYRVLRKMTAVVVVSSTVLLIRTALLACTVLTQFDDRCFGNMSDEVSMVLTQWVPDVGIFLTAHYVSLRTNSHTRFTVPSTEALVPSVNTF